MQVIEIHDGEGQAVASKAEVLQLAESRSSILGVIETWCCSSKGNSSEIYYSEDDEIKLPGIGIGFENKLGWIADLFFDWASLSESKENIRPVTEFIDHK